MQIHLNAKTGWMLATFSLLTLLLVSVTNTSSLTESQKSAETKSATSLTAPEPFIGEISMFGGNFAPRGWALCNGQLLPISQNSALFSLLGTTYGGDGRTTFALPDLRGRVPVHAGRGSGGLSPYPLGSKGGSETLSIPRPVPVTIAPNNGNAQVINGAGQISNVQPYTTINFIIALQGVYPSRS